MQRGDHTWDVHVEYHRCPKCKKILESRKPFVYRLGKYVKEIECEACGHRFTEVKKRKPRFGPLIGDPQPAEVEWK